MPDLIDMAQVPQYFGYAEQKNSDTEEYLALESRQKKKSAFMATNMHKNQIRYSRWLEIFLKTQI